MKMKFLMPVVDANQLVAILRTCVQKDVLWTTPDAGAKSVLFEIRMTHVFVPNNAALKMKFSMPVVDVKSNAIGVHHSNVTASMAAISNTPDAVVNVDSSVT